MIARPPAVQWEDAYDPSIVHVGRPALVRHCGGSSPIICQVCRDDGDVLIQHCHTCELEWVPVEKLRPYHSEPIPEPTR